MHEGCDSRLRVITDGFGHDRCGECAAEGVRHD